MAIEFKLLITVLVGALAGAIATNIAWPKNRHAVAWFFSGILGAIAGGVATIILDKSHELVDPLWFGLGRRCLLVSAVFARRFDRRKRSFWIGSLRANLPREPGGLFEGRQ